MYEYRCHQRPYLDNPTWYNQLLYVHKWYKNGMLPDPGQWLDQADGFLDCMLAVDVGLAEGEEALREKAEAKSKMRSRTPSSGSSQRM